MENKLILLIVFLKMVSSTGEELDLLKTSPPEKVPLDHALYTLEEIVREERIIREFCYKHFFQAITEPSIKTITEPSLKPINVSNCAELNRAGFRTSGVYTIYLKKVNPLDTKINVYCDMESAGGGWTVFQRRGEFPDSKPRLNFTRTWKDYKEGFGNLKEEFWLGNEYIHFLSTQNSMELRVELEDFDGQSTYAVYSTFKVEAENKNYSITVKDYSGNAGDSMQYHKGMGFATFDYDHRNCANKCKSGWWFNDCRDANLNGEYLKGNHEHGGMGVLWNKGRGWNYSYKWSEMKMRPKIF